MPDIGLVRWRAHRRDGGSGHGERRSDGSADPSSLDRAGDGDDLHGVACHQCHPGHLVTFVQHADDLFTGSQTGACPRAFGGP